MPASEIRPPLSSPVDRSAPSKWSSLCTIKNVALVVGGILAAYGAYVAKTVSSRAGMPWIMGSFAACLIAGVRAYYSTRSPEKVSRKNELIHLPDSPELEITTPQTDPLPKDQILQLLNNGFHTTSTRQNFDILGGKQSLETYELWAPHITQLLKIEIGNLLQKADTWKLTESSGNLDPSDSRTVINSNYKLSFQIDGVNHLFVLTCKANITPGESVFHIGIFPWQDGKDQKEEFPAPPPRRTITIIEPLEMFPRPQSPLKSVADVSRYIGKLNQEIEFTADNTISEEMRQILEKLKKKPISTSQTALEQRFLLALLQSKLDPLLPSSETCGGEWFYQLTPKQSIGILNMSATFNLLFVQQSNQKIIATITVSEETITDDGTRTIRFLGELPPNS